MTLLLLSSGVREGAIEYFQIQDYSVIERDKIVAGRLIVYRGEPEMHVTFISARLSRPLTNTSNSGRSMASKYIATLLYSETSLIPS